MLKRDTLKLKSVLFGEGLTGFRVVFPFSGPQKASLLFIHGMWGTADQFFAVMAFCAMLGYDCWCINLSGHAGSGLTSIEDVDFARYVRDVQEAITYIASENSGLPIVPVGHSFGGLIAQDVTKKDGGKLVKTAIFIGTAPPRAIFLRGSIIWHILRHVGFYLRVMCFKKPFMIKKTGAMKFLFNGMRRSDAEVLWDKLVPESGMAAAELMLWRSIRIEPGMPCPTLVIAATEDKLIPRRVLKKVAKYYGSKYEELYGNHMMIEGSHFEIDDLGDTIDIFIEKALSKEFFPATAA